MFLTIKLVYCKIFTFFNNFEKTDSENGPTQNHDFERRLCTQTQ